MKRWQVLVLCAAVLAVAAYFYYYLGFRVAGTPKAPSRASSHADSGPASIQWQLVSRPDEGFRIDMPSDAHETQIPAYNEGGGSEPIKMLYSSPDADTVFALSWADNPPVSRVNHRLADQTLDQARDGMLARTQTTLVRESRNAIGGYPSRDIMARNSQGGILDARFIFINDRLYTLMAMYPSSNTRREQDIIRFYKSFILLRSDTTLPAATPQGA